MPNKQKLKKALDNSLQAEQDAVIDRFAKADQVFSIPSKKPLSERKHAEKPKPKKEKKIKLKRDTFSMPENDHQLIGKIKAQCLKKGFVISKSEVIRAGIHSLNSLSDKELKSAFNNLTKLKPGRQKTK